MLLFTSCAMPRQMVWVPRVATKGGSLQMATSEPFMAVQMALWVPSFCGTRTPMRFMKPVLPTATDSPFTMAVMPPPSWGSKFSTRLME